MLPDREYLVIATGTSVEQKDIITFEGKTGLVGADGHGITGNTGNFYYHSRVIVTHVLP